MKNNYFIKFLIFLISINSYGSFLEFDSISLSNIKEQNLKILNELKEIKYENVSLKDSLTLLRKNYISKNEFNFEIESLLKSISKYLNSNKKLIKKEIDGNKLRDAKIGDINNQIIDLIEKSNTNASALDQSNEKIQSVSSDVIRNQSNSTKISIIIFILIAGILVLSLIKSKSQNNKLKKIFENQIADSQKIVDWLESSVQNELNNEKIVENDHSFAKKLADAINKISYNLSLMDDSVRGHKQLIFSVKRLITTLENNEYEMVELLGMKYDPGMNINPEFITDENLEKGEAIITKILKPQLNYKGKLIQVAEVEVSTNE